VDEVNHRALTTPASSPLVSVIILNYNGLRYLGARLKSCLDSVVECDYQHFEVIFVDNGSTDGSSVFVEESYRNKVLVIQNQRNLGCAKGFNVGIRRSKGKYLALISNDMIVNRNWLNPIIKLMESDRRIGLVGCKRLAYGVDRLIDGIGADLYLCGRLKTIGAGEVDRGQYDADRDDIDFIGGTQIVRRSVIEQVGSFDPGFSEFFSEDIDLCFRVRKAGYKIVYVFDAVVTHIGSATFTGLSRNEREREFISYMMNRNRIRTGIIHFRVCRLLSSFLTDLVWLTVTPSVKNKLSLLTAYAWNIKHLPATLKRRLEIGPSPPYGCKYGMHLAILSEWRAWNRVKHSL